MLVQAMAQGVVAWSSDVTDVWCCLSWLCTHHHCLLVDAAEGINHYLAFNRLDRVNDYSHCSRVESLLTSLSFYVSAWQPRAKTRMWVIPPNATLLSANLFHHVHEGLLVDRVDRFNRDGGAHLRHGEDINDSDGVVIVNFSHHQTHDFKWNACSTMFKHFEESKTWNIDLFSCIILGNFCTWLRLGSTHRTTHSLHQCCQSRVHFDLLS